MGLSKREKMLLIIAILIIGIGSIIMWVIIPLRDNYNQLNNQKNELEMELERINLVLLDTEKNINRLQSEKLKMINIKSLFYNSSSENFRYQVSNKIDNYIKNSGLELRNKQIGLQTINNNENLNKLIYQANLEGDMEQILSFLQDLNNSDRLLRTGQLELRRGDSGENLLIHISVEAVNLKGGIDYE